MLPRLATMGCRHRRFDVAKSPLFGRDANGRVTSLTGKADGKGSLSHEKGTRCPSIERERRVGDLGLLRVSKPAGVAYGAQGQRYITYQDCPYGVGRSALGATVAVGRSSRRVTNRFVLRGGGTTLRDGS
jgi:hypothetical protein